LKAHDFLTLYRADGFIQTLAEGIRALAQKSAVQESSSPSNVIRVKGLHGSLDAVMLAAVHKSVRANHIIILHDKEEAAFFANDMQNLLGEKEIFVFPMSYKRPYEYTEVENANILMRAEVLNQLSNHPEGNIIVTYPEALSEKVINKKSLASNTFVVKKGEQLDRAFLEEFLHTYDFEKTDFVFEAGQFAIRGGIIDVFSFANELPFRIELFGNEVDSIRSFDPGSQLSVDILDKVSLMPNVQTRLVQEERQSIFEFISPSTRIWLKGKSKL
jgi:transcription-repair coupling factor (superfamily II helicase)